MFADWSPIAIVASFTASLTFLSVLHTVISNWLQRRRVRVEKSVALHEELFTAENYTRVIAPVFTLMLKWRNLPDDEKMAYRQVVADGWIGFSNENKNVWQDLVCGSDSASNKNSSDNINQLTKKHFMDRANDGTTEHDALTTFLQFWTKVDGLVSTNMVDKKVLRELMSPTFSYYREFFISLKIDIRERMSERDVEPRWFLAIDRLEKLFGE